MVTSIAVIDFFCLMIFLLFFMKRRFFMSEEKLYAVCVRQSAAHLWGLATKQRQPVGWTIREFVNMEIGRWLGVPNVLLDVTLKEFVNDMKAGFSESKYAKMLGWNYSQATEMIRLEGSIFILISQPHFEARPYSYSKARDDDEYALQLVRDIYAIRGGQIVLEEFDHNKHVLGYEPEVDS
jgi:hypothetical protein